MAYKLTPYDRRVQAELIRQEREARYASRYPTYKKTGAAAVAPVQDEKEKNGFVTALHTAGDVGANLLTGLGKGVEGIVDLFAGLGGAVAGIFSDDAENAVKDFVAKDWTGELYGNAWQEGLDQSALNGTKAGEIIEGIAQGVGQMLPAVAVTALTGGAAAPAALQAASTTLGLATTIASAAGTGAEQAFQEGAGYGQGMLYGAASGAIEGVTEKLTGGATKAVFGKGFLDDALGKVAKTGIKRVAADAVGEGVEEMISEVANPALKSIYKGKAAWQEYGDADFWAGVGEAGIIGAGTSVVYGNTVGRVMKTSGVYADARNVVEHIEQQQKKAQELKKNGSLTNEQAAQLERNIKADYELLSNRLQKVSDKTRARVLKNPQFARAFESDGTLKADFAASLERNIAAAGDSTYRLGYRSTNLDAETITKVLEKNSKDGQTVTAFDGELDEAGKKGLAVFQESMDAIGELNGGKTRYVVVQGLDGNASFDPDSGVIAINADQFSNGEGALVAVKSAVQSELWQGALVHETAHSTEGTTSHAVLADHLMSDNAVYGQAVSDFIERGYFGVDADAATDKLNALLEKSKNGDTLTEQEKSNLDTAVTEIVAIATENVLGNAAFIKRLVKGEPSVAEKILNKIVQIKDAVAGKRTAEQKKAEVFLNRAEQLYLNAIKESGFAYRDGKIVTAHDEDEDEAQKEKAPADGEVRYSKKGDASDPETQSIKEQLQAHASELETMNPVSTVNYSPMNKKELHENISEVFRRIGYKIDRQGFGIIEIGEKQIDKSLNYINTEAEKAAFFSIPTVLKRGIEISEHENHKGREYGTVTIAAKILINDTPGVVGAVVTKIDGHNKYRVHRVVTPDGSTFVFSQKNENTEPTSGEPLSSDKRAPIGSAFNNRIHQNEPIVNRKIQESRKVQYSMAGKKARTTDGEVKHSNKRVVVTIEPNAELEKRIAKSNASRSKVLCEYLIETFSGRTFTMSDGRQAIMDNTDAKELSKRAGPKKTVQLANFEKLIEQARPAGHDYHVEHRKFTEFHYYAVTAQWGVETMDLLLNVGVTKNDGTNHIYAITENKREAPTHYGVSGPVGNRIESASPNNSISETEPNVNRKIQESRKVQYSMAGKKARTADKMKLATAQQMIAEGVDSETVRRETGWFQGYDGEWRFEIDDSQMEFSREGYGINELEKLMKEERKLVAEITYNEFENPDKDISELNERHKALVEKMKNTPAVTLPFYVKHDALFEAYPELRQVKVVLKPRGYSGGYAIKENEIRIDSRFSDEEIKSALLHEIQHVVQRLEGFSGGANATYWAQKIGEENPEAYETALDKLSKSRRDMLQNSSKSFLVKVRDFLRLTGNTKIQDYSPEQKAIFEDLEVDEEGWMFGRYMYHLQKVIELDQKFGKNHPYDMYLRTAGEVEARDTARRISLTAEQRKDIRPDIDRTNVLFADKESVFFGKDVTDFDNIILPDEVKYSGSNVQYEKRRYKQITKQEYAVISSRIAENNSKFMARNEPLPKLGVARSANYFYVYENLIPGEFGVLKQIEIDTTDKEYLSAIEEQIRSVNKSGTYTSTSDVNKMLDVLQGRRRRNRSNHADGSDGRSDRGNGRISSKKSQGDGIGNTRGSNEDRRDVKRSRKQTGETVTLSKGQIAALRADYPESVVKGETVANFIEEVNKMLDSSRRSKRKKRIGTITQDHAAVIEPLMKTLDPNFSAEGYELWIDGTGAEHIEIRHGQNGEADQSMASKETKELIPIVADHPDDAGFIRDDDGNLELSDRFFNSDNSKAPQIRLLKQVDGDTIYVSECVPDSANKRIYITSAYIKKGSTDQLLNMDPDGSLQPTPEASFDGSATTISIDNSRPIVKRKIQESRKAGNGTVTVSEGQYAQKKANYTGEQVFYKKNVGAALRGIGGIADIGSKRLNELIDGVWKTFNTLRSPSSFDRFIEVAKDSIFVTMVENSNGRYDNALHSELISLEKDIETALRRAQKEGAPSVRAKEKAKLADQLETERKKMTEELEKQFEDDFEFYRQGAEYWKDKHDEIYGRQEALGKAFYAIQQLKKVKTGAFFNHSNYKSDDIFKASLEKLVNTEYRGDLNKSGTRNIIRDIRSWYAKDNPMLGSRYETTIADMLDSIADEQGELNAQEIYTLAKLVEHFKGFIETFNKYIKNGKYLDAEPEVKRFIDIIERNKCLPAGKMAHLFSGFRARYGRAFFRPLTLAAYNDRYEDGFNTRMVEEFAKGEVNAHIVELEIMVPLVEFGEGHKKYFKQLSKRTVSYRGTNMSVNTLISLYWTLGSEDAHAALVVNGYECYDNVKKIIDHFGIDPGCVDGMDLDSKKAKRILKKACEQARAEIDSLLTDEDRAFIKAGDEAFELCRKYKYTTDMLMKYCSNVKEGRYYPQYPADKVHSVDTNIFEEADRGSSASFNKARVKHKSQLFILPATDVIARHVKGIAIYSGLSPAVRNFDVLYNLNLSDNPNHVRTIRKVSKNSWGNPAIVKAEGESARTAMDEYFAKLMADAQGVKKGDNSKFLEMLRGNTAKGILAANPKTILTQLSSILASTSILDPDSIFKGFKVAKFRESTTDIDTYSKLARIRNDEGGAVLAQTNTDSQNTALGKTSALGDFLMEGIAKTDRFVANLLWGACQMQIEKDTGEKVGTKENKQKAGDLLDQVFFKTQQNSLATTRSNAMRSSNVIMRTIVTFTADAMNVFGQVIDPIGELYYLDKKIKMSIEMGASKEEIDSLKERRTAAHKKLGRGVGSLVATATFCALVSLLFRYLFHRIDDEDEPKDVIKDTIFDGIGNMIGGLPIFSDIYSFFATGYGVEDLSVGTVNKLLESGGEIWDVAGDIVTGKADSRGVARMIRNVFFAGGQALGIPTRNVYNIAYGVIGFSKEGKYNVDNWFYKPTYSSDLQKAIEAGDENMIETIAGLMIDEKIGIEDVATRKTLQDLTSKGYKVLPRSVGDSVTVDGETVELTGTQQKKLREVYAIGQDAVADMVKLKQFAEADEKVQAAAIKFIYDVYWDLALEDALGVDLAEKNVLFAEAIDIEKLAVIVAMARSIEADKDKNGKAISGTRKRKVQTFVNSLRLSAAEKYMVMGYLGYTNVNGEQQVMAYINKLNLNQYEKIALREYCGYSLSSKDREKMYTYTQKDKYAPYGGQDPNDPDRIAPK